MFADLMTILCGRLKDMNLFSDIHPLARVVKSDGKTFPVVYKGYGQGVPFKWDGTSGMCYFRKRSQISFNENTEERFRINSCDGSIIYNITVPLRLVIFINAGKADFNNVFSPDFFAEWIIGDISGVFNITGAYGSQLTSTGYETNTVSVLQSEYSHPPEDMNYEYSYLYIDFDLEIIANQACLNSCVNPIVSGGSTTGSLAMQPYKIATSPHTNPKYKALIGVVNGINKIFQVPEGKFEDDENIMVFYNGQFTGDFTVVKAIGTITTGFTPKQGQITVFYI